MVSGFMRWSKRTRGGGGGGGGVMRNNCKLVVRKSFLSSQLYTLDSPSGMTQVFTRAHFTPRFTQSAARSQVSTVIIVSFAAVMECLLLKTLVITGRYFNI